MPDVVQFPPLEHPAYEIGVRQTRRQIEAQAVEIMRLQVLLCRAARLANWMMENGIQTANGEHPADLVYDLMALTAQETPGTMIEALGSRREPL